jgi:hypothetical protein
MSSFIEQGLNFFANKKEKEGYRGILGPDSNIDSLNQNDVDFTSVSSLKNNLSQGIDDYNTKYTALKTKTNDYLGMTANYGSDKNYNIFINKPMGYREITATPYVNGYCIANGASNSALQGLTDASTRGFDTAYPNNFPNTAAGATEATNACKLWAADTQSSSSSSSNPDKTYFALTKDNVTNKFKCYTGDTLSGTPQQYTVKRVAYSVASSNDATRGGLFMNGTVGVYNEVIPETNYDPTNQYNVNTRFAAPLAGYTTCDRFTGGALNLESINATLGANCTNITNAPVKVRYVYIKSSQDPSIGDGYIQISQLAVFGFLNGVGQNVASQQVNNKATAGSGNGPNYTNVTNSGYAWTSSGGWSMTYRSWPSFAVDGVLSSRPFPNGYHSASPGRNEWWSLDLGKEFPVYQIDYYNRAGCCPWRAKGMTMQLSDGNGTVISLKDPKSGVSTNTLIFNDNAKQSFVIAQ